MKPIAHKGFSIILTNNLYWSKAYQSLTLSARNLMWAFIAELRFSGSRAKGTFEYTNNGKISFTEYEFKAQGLGASETYLRARNQLIRTGFIEITYQPNSAVKRHIRYVFHKLETHFRKKTEPPSEIYSPGKVLDKEINNIEHWAPQQFKDEEDSYYEIYKELNPQLLDNIGNLFVMYYRKNSSLQNLSPEKKYNKSINEKSESRVFESFLSEYKENHSRWDKSMIEERAKNMAEICYKKIFNLEKSFLI